MRLNPQLLIGAANAFVGLHEEGGDNRGQMIEKFLKGVQQQPGAPWCAAFVHHVGYWSHYDTATGQSSWPLVASASCNTLGQYARVLKVLVTQPQVGDLFLLYSKEQQRFHHIGIVVAISGRYPIAGGDTVTACTTIEGNTNDDGSVNGVAVLRKTRRFNSFVGDRFIRWTALSQQMAA